ncbi:MAG: 3-methyl-2-oxobutanoate hydroxymethyltransferase [Acidimicrobiales bacterium]|jgi:3-methyl-2-oxobutanoate hydroxymethyltransferase|nr:3-methyl-2-oxobutanoate hydroxymethyltransferase [Acidimicrobiales bacterium]MDP6322726.1 3-methyl-2-oxobutanoate hydroxymethyltransferase [Acidimicrobiales bacterium]HJM28719.1 3-methyl-2-oxobutanoate hydroxymethyltransferase [Acidimicrobiales bacterium]HJM97332.1 3-methyl-2-oxobutanoate hydroxymethyltransferase [Acidimicrobiales bacterium]
MGSNWTAPKIAKHKVSDGETPLVMLTAYDAPGAHMVVEAGTDIILVGDSLAMVVLGYEDTLQVTIDDMAHHTAAVARAEPDAFIVADLPWMSYHVSTEETVKNAAKLIRAGAKAVKLEGGQDRVRMVEAIASAEIPVMGHLGLTPQSVLSLGGYKVQGRTTNAAVKLSYEAKALAHAGCFAIVLECVPSLVGKMITDSLSIPTIGIGAGPDCDGQVLVFHDLLGIYQELQPKYVRTYANLKESTITALSAFNNDVRDKNFPTEEESYKISAEEAEELGLYGAPLPVSEDPLASW